MCLSTKILFYLSTRYSTITKPSYCTAIEATNQERG